MTGIHPTMSKAAIRAQLAADHAAFVKEREVELIVAQKSPMEYRRILGPSKKPGTVKPRDPKHEVYQQWLTTRL